jgi:hypothetical protein
VCDVVVEETPREGEGVGSNPVDLTASQLYPRKWGRAGGWPVEFLPYKRFFLLFILSFFCAGPKTSVLTSA